MRASVWRGPEQMSVDELPDPEPAEGEVLLAPEAVGVCGSELEGYLGLQSNRTPPLVMGHGLAGRVVGLGHARILWAGHGPSHRGTPCTCTPDFRALVATYP